MKFFYSLFCSILLLPGFGLAQSAEFDTLLAQVPAPPKTVAEAAARWQDGNESA